MFCDQIDWVEDGRRGSFSQVSLMREILMISEGDAKQIKVLIVFYSNLLALNKIPTSLFKMNLSF